LSAPAGCVSLPVPGFATALAAPVPAERPRSKQPEPGPAPPFDERELERLLSALEPVKSADGRATRTRAFSRRPPLPLERMESVVGDVTAQLMMIHLEERLEKWRLLPDLPRPEVEWAEQVLQALDECLEGRFAPFGGSETRETTRQMVVDKRKVLEDRLMRPFIEQRLAERDDEEDEE